MRLTVIACDVCKKRSEPSVHQLAAPPGVVEIRVGSFVHDVCVECATTKTYFELYNHLEDLRKKSFEREKGQTDV